MFYLYFIVFSQIQIEVNDGLFESAENPVYDFERQPFVLMISLDDRVVCEIPDLIFESNFD